MNSICFVIVSSLLFYSVNCDNERKLSYELNPGCNLTSTYCEYNTTTLVYIQSQGENDTIHYIWDFTGTPGILIAKTDLNASLVINWNDFMTGIAKSVNFTKTPRYVFSALLHRIYLFDDPSDKANIADASISNVIPMNPHFFKWTLENLTKHDENSIVLLMRAQIGKSNDSSINMKVSCTQ
jgi:Lysosomal transcription factor, NCU-G1